MCGRSLPRAASVSANDLGRPAPAALARARPLPRLDHVAVGEHRVEVPADRRPG